MKVLLINIFCLVFFCLNGFVQQPQPSFEKERNIEAEEIASKIQTNLSFSAEVADVIIENDMGNRIVDKNFSTYGEAKEYFIHWVRKNPIKAADIYLRAAKKDPLLKKSEITMVIPKSHLTDEFMALVNNLKSSAENAGLGKETLRLDSARLFEGFVDYGFGGIEIPWEKREIQKSEPVVLSGFASLRLNANALRNEEEFLKIIAEDIKNTKSEIKKFKDIYLKKTLKFEQLYGEFMIAASKLKGRKMLNDKEGKEIEDLRMKIRKTVFALKLALIYSQLSFEIEKLPDSSLKTKLLDFLAWLEKNISGAENPEKSVSEIFKDLSFSMAFYNSISEQIYLFSLCENLEKRIKELSFSGFYDYFFYEIFSFLSLNNSYKEARLKAKESAAVLAVLKESVLTTDIENKNSEFFSKTLSSVSGIAKTLALIESISSHNRKMQFYSFEILWPFSAEFYSASIPKPVLNFEKGIFQKENLINRYFVSGKSSKQI